ncbi:MAG: superoxide dismutase [Bryobacterales bacterium]|nr:superoxide dismutase [Bryobacterales bacterium]
MTGILAGGAVAAGAQAAAPAFTLPKLPYAFDALEPYIDARTMEIHHDKHHQAYVDNLNKAIAAHAEWAKYPVEELLGKFSQLPEGLKTAVRNQGGGHANHSLFWQVLGKPTGKAPQGRLARDIDRSFGGLPQFQSKLKAAAMGVFGSGWAWLNIDSENRLLVEASANQDSPWMMQRKSVLGIDVWEHAYYLKYQNRRAEYLDAILHVLDWAAISHRYEQMGK